jgi:acetyltransferase-like isoleucine patch superfamily enzyme
MFQILGDSSKQSLGHDINYYKDRNIFLDCRGSLQIHYSAMFGFNIFIYTYSHDIKTPDLQAIEKSVTIGANTFIGSNSIIYNSVIDDGAVVSVGTVVRNMTVPKDSMVLGNPAVIVARKLEGKWRRNEILVRDPVL